MTSKHNEKQTASAVCFLLAFLLNLRRSNRLLTRSVNRGKNFARNSFCSAIAEYGALVRVYVRASFSVPNAPPTPPATSWHPPRRPPSGKGSRYLGSIGWPFTPRPLIDILPRVAWIQRPNARKRVWVSHIGATILHPNTKVLDFQGFFVFLGVKNHPFHHCTFSPTLWT